MYKTIIEKLEKKIVVIGKIYDAKIKEYQNTICPTKPWGNGYMLEQAEKIAENRAKLKTAMALVKEVFESNKY